MKLADLFAETNRGLVLDIMVFIVNLGLMSLLTKQFAALIRSAGENDELAQLTILGCAVAMLVLPAAGASLKRWHFHKRKKALANKPRNGALEQDSNVRNWLTKPINTQSKTASGCLTLGFGMSALFYFCLSIFLSAAVLSLLQALIFGKRADRPVFFTIGVIVLLTACVVQTVLVYRYFIPPKKTPRTSFLRDPKAEQLGDLCIFTNMILFQVFWNIVIVEFPWGRVTSIGALVGNLFFLSFIALLIYFPPRIFYLAEDFRRPATWITILLANSPTILRVLSGENQITDW